jgi:A/G-specific adenine glycosylase
VEAFPTIKHLAEASQEQVYKLWEGLGYYSRARNMHETAKFVVHELYGEFPNTYKDIIKLKGIGPYTAAAISSFAFQEDQAVLDGNVFRVISRLYNESSSISEAKNRKLFQGLVDNLLPKGKSADFNQAIMDFGAIQCKPKNPCCSKCVLAEHCKAFRKGNVSELPIKKKAAKKKDRYFYFLDLRPNNESFPVIKRVGKDIWQGLYSFPYVDSEKEIKEMSSLEWQNNLKIPLEVVPKLVWQTKHILSHQILHCSFFRIDSTSVVNENSIIFKSKKYKWIENTGQVPWPVVISKYLEASKSI